MIPPKHSLKIQEKLAALSKVAVGDCIAFSLADWPAWRHAFRRMHQETKMRFTLRTTAKNKSLWRVK
jgi:hypothetical protein